MAPINSIMYLFSSVPTTPYLSLDYFPELKILQDNWEIIRDEAMHLYSQGLISASDKPDDAGFNSFFRRGWKRFYLKWYKEPMSSAKILCPKTIELIQKIPTINSALFTLLPKNSDLMPHRDPYAGSLRYHLGLLTPNSEQCTIHIDDIPYSWKNGEAVLFDETFIHHAKNTSDMDRIILFCDIQRPLKSKLIQKFSHFLNKTIMKASAGKNLANEDVGNINKAFKYIYKARQIGKKLKIINIKIYYLVKFSIFGAFFYLFFL